MTNTKKITMKAALWATIGLTAFTCSFAANYSAQKSIRLDKIKVATGVTVPSDYVDALQKALTERLAKSKVLIPAPANDPAGTPEADLRLSCTITSFTPGSRVKRMVSSYGRYFGVGATRMTIRASVEDEAQHKLIFDEDIQGAKKGDSLIPMDQYGGSKGIVTIEAEKVIGAVAKSVKAESKEH